MFGIGPMELLLIAVILAVLAVPVIVVIGVVAYLCGATVIFLGKRKPPE